MARLWSMTVDYLTVSVGDQLPILVKWETSDSIRRLVAKYELTTERDDESGELSENLATPAPAIVGYVTELLQKAFPIDSVTAEGSSLEFDLVKPINAGDTVSVFGEVVGKQENDGLRLVECRIVIEKETGGIAATAYAVVSL